ncbi:hypothetical protein ScPMuIL_000063 [Solemya velum]
MAYLEHKVSESIKIRETYKDRIPVIVEKDLKSAIPDIDKKEFLVPSGMTVAQLMWLIRKRIQLPSKKDLFLFVGKILPHTR